jgi:transcriptional regulator with PAS, ATPase and Fis domain
VSRGRYGNVRDLFELTKKTGFYPEEIRELAEAFGMMLVKVEAREFHGRKLIESLEKARAELSLARERLARENVGLRRTLGKQYSPRRIIGRSRPLQDLLAEVDRIADTPVSVLITGETGTGKELIARALHYNSVRGEGPFIALNCTAIPETLLESELFGIEKGVATGIDRRAGRIEQAHGGTLFLDEIGDMPLTSQAKILRVLEDREVVRLGARKPVPVDIRIVTATNRNLKEEAARGRFREDLYYRINVVHLHIPPLRERREDIPLLLRSFLDLSVRKMGREPMEFGPAAMECLKRYPWPGNVRELENEVDRIVALAASRTVRPEDLSRAVREGGGPEARPAAASTDGSRESEKDLIERILSETRGNRSEAARSLGISREGLRKKMIRHGIV